MDSIRETLAREAAEAEAIADADEKVASVEVVLIDNGEDTAPAALEQFARMFFLHRKEDETGVSGPGIVAEGVEFWDGTVAMRWRSGIASTAVYDSVESVEKIHGHGGKTDVVYVNAAQDDYSQWVTRARAVTQPL